MLQLTNQLLSAAILGNKASPAKAAKKIGIELTAQQIYGLKLLRDGLVNTAVTEGEINLVYTECTASSCMKSKRVGGYYSKAGVVCIHTQNARALVNPEGKLFYKVYGEDHASLSSLLELCGYVHTKEWLPHDIDTRLLIKKTKKVFVPYVVSSLTQVWYTERETDCCYRRQQWVVWGFNPDNLMEEKVVHHHTSEGIPDELRTSHKRLVSSVRDWGSSFKQPVLQRRTRKFVDVAMKEKEIYVWEKDNTMYVPYVDGDTAQRPSPSPKEEWELVVPFRAKVLANAKKALRKGKKIKLAA